MNLLRFLSLLAVVQSVSVTTLLGQAYCALRDPVNAIYELFPESDSYRSIVRTIDESIRVEVSRNLPFSLHFNELGRHTLYVPTKGIHPVGLVHVRSEAGPWGLVEIAWSLNSDLSVRGLSFQRCRSRAKAEIENDLFQERLRGKNFANLKTMLTSDGKQLVPGTFDGLSPQGEELAAIVVRSCLKTIEVTRLAWKLDIKTLLLLDHAYTAFPEGRSIELFEEVYSSKTFENLNKYLDQKTGTGIRREDVSGMRVLDESGSVIGHVMRTHWSSLGNSLDLWWNVTPDLVIKNVIPEGDWPDNETKAAFMEAKGVSFADLSSCQTAAQIVGAEILVVSKSLEDLH